jgi:hypothetical protein
MVRVVRPAGLLFRLLLARILSSERVARDLSTRSFAKINNHIVLRK